MPFRGPEGPRSEPFVAGLDALDGPVLRLAKYTPTAAPKALRIVHHEKERRHRDPKSASSPAPRQSDGRGHRRGLDGPSMPNPLKEATALPREC